jgi:hypothetical protein
MDWALVDDKVTLFEHFQRNDIATPAVYVAFGNGKVTHWLADQPGELPRCDLAFTLTTGYGGRGFEHWEYVPSGNVWRFAQRELTEEELLIHGRQTSQQEACMLQCCIGNHPELAGFSRGGLCTIRMMTYQTLSGEIGVGFAHFRMPTGSSYVDNQSAGGLHATVDLATGRICAGKTSTVGAGMVHEHQDTKARFFNVKLPDWQQAIDLCCRAHQSLPGFVFIGWDVIPTEDGPQLLEGNTLWGMPESLPLGQTPFTQCVLSRLQPQA